MFRLNNERKLILKSLVVISLLLSFLLVNAQQSDKDLGQYFEDEGISVAKGIWKTDVIAMIHGDWPVIYEHLLSDQFSVEGGIGLLMPYYVHDFLALAFAENRGITNNQLGWSIKLQGKLYTGDIPDSRYWGFQVYNRSFSDIGVTELYFTNGKQRFIGKRVLIDYGIGLGIRLQNVRGEQTIFDPDFGFSPIVPLFIKIGFISKPE